MLSVPCLCLYLVFVCTLSLSPPCLCLHLVFVFTLFCLYLVLVFTLSLSLSVLSLSLLFLVFTLSLSLPCPFLVSLFYGTRDVESNLLSARTTLHMHTPQAVQLCTCTSRLAVCLCPHRSDVRDPTQPLWALSSSRCDAASPASRDPRPSRSCPGPL